MLPAIVIILFCNVLATIGSAAVNNMDNFKKLNVIGILAVQTIVPAAWQTAEVWNVATQRDSYGINRGY